MKTVQGPIHSVLCTCHLCEEWREKQKSQRIDDAYIAAARNYTNDELEIDAEPAVSTGADSGAWVAAWVWVSDSEAGICSECGEPGAADGEGYDGKCASCADKEVS